MKKYGFGVDVGGTTVKMGFFETSGELLDKWEIKTDTSDNGKAILPDIAQAMQMPVATWMSVMSQSSTNSAIMIWCIAAAVYERSHTQLKRSLEYEA